MKSLFIILFLCVVNISSYASSYNKLNFILKSYIQKTDIGNHAFNEYRSRYGNFGIRYHCFDASDQSTRCKEPFYNDEEVLYIHSGFATSSNEYLSWIIFLGLSEAVLKHSYNLDLIPKVVELEQLLFIKSMLFWRQLNLPMQRDTDFYESDGDNAAKRMDLPLRKLINIFQPKDMLLFVNTISSRSRTQRGVTLSVADIFYSKEFSPAQKEVATDIEYDLKSLLFNLESI